MPDTRKQVHVVTDHPEHPGRPVVLVDGELLRGVTRIRVDHTYDQGPLRVELTLHGVDVDFEGAPDYFVRVVGPSPEDKPKPQGEPAAGSAPITAHRGEHAISPVSKRCVKCGAQFGTLPPLPRALKDCPV